MCSDSLESGALPCAEGAVVRRGDTLAIMLYDGRTVHRVDNRLMGDDFVSFTYAGRLGGSSGTPVFHILDITGPESWAIELINARTGDSVVVADRPLLSPDGARFALARMDLETCEGGNVLEVWRITGDVPVQEFTLEPYDCTRNRGWGASDLEWISRDTLGLLRNTHWKAAQRARADIRHEQRPARPRRLRLGARPALAVVGAWRSFRHPRFRGCCIPSAAASRRSRSSAHRPVGASRRRIDARAEGAARRHGPRCADLEDGIGRAASTSAVAGSLDDLSDAE